MERLIGLAVNDASLLAPWVERSAPALALDALGGRGYWGLGFLGHGELLVKRARLGGGADPVAALRALRTRHVIIAADGAPRPRRLLEDAQPLRYRDWLFAASGLEALGEGFVDAARTASRLSALGARPGTTADEALMLVFMDALYRGHARDTRKMAPDALRDGVRDGARAARQVAGPAAADLVVLLYGHEHLFAVTLGRALAMATTTGEAWAREGRAIDARRQTHLRAVVVSDQASGSGPWERVVGGLVVGHDAVAVPFDLDP